MKEVWMLHHLLFTFWSGIVLVSAILRSIDETRMTMMIGLYRWNKERIRLCYPDTHYYEVTRPDTWPSFVSFWLRLASGQLNERMCPSVGLSVPLPAGPSVRFVFGHWAEIKTIFSVCELVYCLIPFKSRPTRYHFNGFYLLQAYLHSFFGTRAESGRTDGRSYPPIKSWLTTKTRRRPRNWLLRLFGEILRIYFRPTVLVFSFFVFKFYSKYFSSYHEPYFPALGSCVCFYELLY